MQLGVCDNELLRDGELPDTECEGELEDDNVRETEWLGDAEIDGDCVQLGVCDKEPLRDRELPDTECEGE